MDIKEKAMTLFFVTGIDTEIGKTIVTGNIAKYLASTGVKVTTMKPVQTGCTGMAEDIVTHRSIMGVEPDIYDKNMITAPEIFKFPASPHLAAELESRTISFERIDKCIQILNENFEVVLIEGAGGIYVPLTRDYTTLDFVAERNLPVIIVSSPRLGSINHTMMTVEMLKSRNIRIAALVYNMYPPEKESIATDSIKIIKHLSEKLGLKFPVFINPFMDKECGSVVEFKGLI